MSVAVELYDTTMNAWVDKTPYVGRLERRITARQIEYVEGETRYFVFNVGDRIRIKENNVIKFEGTVYEVRRFKTLPNILNSRFTAYSDLINYDKYVVFRSYTVGTYAGDIIKDLASLEADVDVTNVDDGPQLTQDWEIQGEKALEVMKNVARGTNYWLRMKPGKILYFKPKVVV